MAIREVTRTEYWLDPDPKSYLGQGPVKFEWVGDVLLIGAARLTLDEAQQHDLFLLLRERHD